MVNTIKNDPIIKHFMPIFKKYDIYLVGGFIRDLILGEKSTDRDLVLLNNSPKILAEEIAKYSGGTCILLDIENEIYRVVLKDKINYFDITKTTNIENDYLRRDFTINSIYFNLNTNEIFDPLKGAFHIENKILKTASLKNFDDDPLRMLRAFRFASKHNFKIEDEILSYIEKNHSKINTIAPERVNYEIIKMFEGDFVVQNLETMYKSGLLAEIFPFTKEIAKIPPNTHHHLPLLGHSFETIRQLNTQNPLLKIAALMHDIGKPKTWTIEKETGRHRFIGHDIEGYELAIKELKRLKFSRKQIDFISKMVLHHIYPSALMQQKNVGDKALIRFIKKLDPYVDEVITLAKADRLSALGEAITKDKIEENLTNLAKLKAFYEKIKPKLKTLPKLLDGKEIMEILNIKAGKGLGEVILQLNEAQLEGLVFSKEGAIEFIKNLKKV